MVKSYKEYIKEHFGAITIEYPPEHMFVRNPSVPTPLSINTHVGGIGRMPMHWNNSPYLSGGFGGAGGGRFGQDPTGEEEGSDNKEKNKILDYQSDLALSYLIEKFSVVDDNLSNTKYENICMSMLENIESGKLDLVDDDTDGTINDNMLSIGVEIFYERTAEPTEGSSGDYFNPPEGGENGEYESYITGPINSSNKELFNNIFEIDSVNELPSLDDIVINFRKNLPSISLAILKTGLSRYGILEILNKNVRYIEGRLESKYESLDEYYFEGNGYYEDHEDIFEQFDELNLGVLLYLTKLCNNSYNKQRTELYKKIEGINNKYRGNINPNKRKEKIEEVNRVLSMVINIPEKLR
jgi:hypothetical protein